MDSRYYKEMIIERLELISDPEIKLKYLLRNKADFREGNSSSHRTDDVLAWYDDLISQARFEFQLAINRPEKLPLTQHPRYNEEIVGKYVKNTDLFYKVEEELVKLSYIIITNDRPKWIINKKRDSQKRTMRNLVDLFYYLKIRLQIFKPIYQRKPVDDFKIRQFLSEHYGFDRPRLNRCWKDYKPNPEMAANSFFILGERLKKSFPGWNEV